MASADIKIPGYDKIRLIKRCGQAEVWEVVRQSLNQRRALKLLRPELCDSPNAVARLKQEAQIAASLHHPNIVRVWDLDKTDGRYYLLMDLVDGPSLDEVISREGAISLERCRRLLADVGPALDYAHGQGVIHRDVKPGNILFTREGSARLTDFGIARAADSGGLTIAGTLLGTPPYMSPEQCSGRTLNGQTDLFSLASVVFEALTGRRPFDRTNDHSTMYAIVNEPPPLQLVPPNLREFFRRAFEKNPAARFQTGSQMADAFAQAVRVAEPQPRRVVKQKKVRVPKPPRPRRTPVLKTRRAIRLDRRWPLAAALVVTVVGLGVLIHKVTEDDGPIVNNPPSKVRVPHVVGESISNATADLRKSGLTAKTDPSVEANLSGVVSKTDPSAGTEVKSGTTVTLWVSSLMPDLVGLSRQDAYAKLRELGHVGEVHSTPAFDPIIAPGIVKGTKPGAGETVDPSAVVSLWVNSTDARAWLDMADKAFGAGQYRLAGDLSVAANKISPGHAEVYYFLGCVYEKNKHPKSAFRMFGLCKEADTSRGKLWTYADKYQRHLRRVYNCSSSTGWELEKAQPVL